MTARRILPAALLVVAAVAVTLVLILRGGGGDQQPQLAEDTPEIDVQLVLSPRTPAFGDILTATLVYPWRAHERRVLNVFSAVGTALLGQRVGDRIHWPLENGVMKILHVLGVPYQPEAAGHAHL